MKAGLFFMWETYFEKRGVSWEQFYYGEMFKRKELRKKNKVYAERYVYW